MISFVDRKSGRARRPSFVQVQIDTESRKGLGKGKEAGGQVGKEGPYLGCLRETRHTLVTSSLDHIDQIVSPITPVFTPLKRQISIL